ncbi:MAG: ribosomal protein S18-alanine N-acetyltransferase [Chloroflexaceae bacterium]|nr:ribosomal protein S18-alanine N-acetyltransferase [Chloroflexaceae bacterium]NJO06047.1 ribosomal protein S18-alanine N-acetyltransferase [Chloroflexaceae bacterium]
MTDADIPQVQEVEQASFSTVWSPNTYRRELRNPARSRYIVARASDRPPPPRSDSTAVWKRWGLLHTLVSSLINNPAPSPASTLVGYAGVWVTLDEAHVTTIAVDPQHRGRGVGELLLNNLIDLSLEMGATALTLEVRESNASAQQLYLKYGFTPSGRRKRYYTDNGEDAIIMWTETLNSVEYQARLRELRHQLFARLRAQAHQPDPERTPLRLRFRRTQRAPLSGHDQGE